MKKIKDIGKKTKADEVEKSINRLVQDIEKEIFKDATSEEEKEIRAVSSSAMKKYKDLLAAA